jgi:hypothetical protein
MSERIEQIEALKEVFDKAKNAPRDEDDCFIDLHLRGALFSAIYHVGKNGIVELKDEVFSYLKDPYDDFRLYAVTALCGCNGLQLDEYKDIAYEIWLNDLNDDVKAIALNSWAEYYINTKNPIILKYLYNVFTSEKYSIRVRVYALYSFMDVADSFSHLGESSEILGLTELEDHNALTKAVDWGKINRLMQQYVPGWKK